VGIVSGMLIGKIGWNSSTVFQLGSVITVTCGRMWRGIQRMVEFVLIRAQHSLTQNTKSYFLLRWRKQVNRMQGACKLCSSAPATLFCQALLLFKVCHKMQSTVHFAKYNHALNQTM